VRFETPEPLEPRTLLSGDPASGIDEVPTPMSESDTGVTEAEFGKRTPTEDPGLIVEAYAVVEDGRPIAYLRNENNAWFRVDVVYAAGIRFWSGADRAEAVVDRDAGLVHVISTAGDRLARFITFGAGQWLGGDLAGEDPRFREAGDGLTVFVTPGREDGSPTGREDFVHVASRDADGDLILYRRIDSLDATLGRTSTWSSRDLSDELRQRGFEAPALVGELTSCVTPWGAQTILGVDATGEVHAIWTAPALNGQWRTDNLSDISSAPAFTGAGLSVFQTDWNGVHIAGFDADGDMQVMWWLPQFEGRWDSANFSDRFDFTPLQPETITTYVTPWGGLNILGLDGSGDLTAYWWAPAFLSQGDTWREVNLTEFLAAEPGRTPDGPVELAGRLRVGASPAEISIVGATVSDGAGRYVFDNQARTWTAFDLDARATDLFPRV